MRVLFINPPNVAPKDFAFPSLVFQPTGLAYLAAVLEKEGMKVKIIDAFGEGWDRERAEGESKITGLTDGEIKQKIKRFRPQIVGVAAPFTFQAKMALRMLGLVRETDQKIITLVGGADASIRYRKLLEDPNLDLVIIGEGEKTIVEIVRGIREKKGITGIAFRKKGRVVKTGPRPFIKNLDRLPLPARHLLPMSAYFEAARKAQAGRVVSTLGKRWATVITSRGCSYNCIFCTVHQVMGRGWRARSPENIIEEIRRLVEKYKIEHLLIEDDNLTLDKKRAEKLFDLMIKEDLGVTWSTPNGVRADKLDENLVEKMKLAGCTRLCVAPESGDQEVVNKIIKKNLNLKMVEKVVGWCKKYKLPVEAFFVIGFPGETKKQIRKTLNFAKKLLNLGLEEFSLFLATPFYGTKLYEIAKRKGYLRDVFLEENLKVQFQDVPMVPLIETPEFDSKDLLRFRQEAVRMSPKFSLSKIKLGLRVFLADPRLALKLAWGRLK